MVIEKHVGSGLTLSLSEHKSNLNSEIESDETRFDGFKVELAKDLVNHMMESVKREFPIDNKLRAWQLKSTMRYFVAYAKKVSQYFVLDLQQYLIVGTTRKAIFDTMQSFRDELSNQEMGPTETKLRRCGPSC
jgi:CRISPR/Cas system CMR subunit Cmr6 (Cas7 group RAMP superfamily)